MWQEVLHVHQIDGTPRQCSGNPRDRQNQVDSLERLADIPVQLLTQDQPSCVTWSLCINQPVPVCPPDIASEFVMISVEGCHAEIGIEMRGPRDLLILSIRGLPIRTVETDSSNSQDDEVVIGDWLPSGVCDGITASRSVRRWLTAALPVAKAPP